MTRQTPTGACRALITPVQNQSLLIRAHCNGETFPALGAPSVDDVSAAFCGHALQKAMCPESSLVAWLVCPLHDIILFFGLVPVGVNQYLDTITSVMSSHFIRSIVISICYTHEISGRQ